MGTHRIRLLLWQNSGAMDRFQRTTTVTLLIISLASLALTLFSVVRYRGYERGIVEPLKEDLVRRTRQAAQQIDSSLAPAPAAVEAMVQQLDSLDSPSEAQLLELLRQAVLSSDSNYGGTIAFEPQRFDPDQRLYAPYLGRKNGELAFLRIEENYDYTDPIHEWYSRALAEGPRWSEPYFDTSVGDVLMTTYSGVFGGREDPRGVVTIDVSMDSIRNVVRSLDLEGVGYAILLSHDGRFLYHPNPELVHSGTTLLDRAADWNDRRLTAIVERILEGGSGIADHRSPTTGLDTWFVYEPVSTTGWSIVAAFVKEDAPIDTGVLRRWQIVIGAAALLFLVSAFHTVHVRREVYRLGLDIDTLEHALLEQRRRGDNLRLELEKLASPAQLKAAARKNGIAIVEQKEAGR